MKQIAKALGLPETADEAACLTALGSRVDVKALAKALGLPETADAAACLSAAGKAGGALKPFARALGLPETADEAACLSAIGTARSGGNDMVAQLQASLAATTTQFQTLQAGIRGREIGELLDAGLKDRKIVPAQREHLEKLCATDEGLTGVRAMLAATAPGLQASGLDGRAMPDGGSADPVALAAKATKLQRERAEAGQPIGYAEAVALVAEAP